VFENGQASKEKKPLKAFYFMPILHIKLTINLLNPSVRRNDTQLNDTEDNGLVYDTQHK
jgi:hypothetical protein